MIARYNEAQRGTLGGHCYTSEKDKRQDDPLKYTYREKDSRIREIEGEAERFLILSSRVVI